MKIAPAFRKTRRRGIFLIEMLGILVILTAASVLAGEIFISSLRVMKQTRERDTLISRVDSALDALRRDAWSAQSAKLAGDSKPETGIQFRLPAGDIIWTMNGTTLTRTDPAGARSWIELPAFQFAVGPHNTVQLAVESGLGGAARHEHLSLATPRITGGAQ